MSTVTQPGAASELCDVYLLHFDQPIGNRHSCQHYCGSAVDLPARLRKHRTDPDARLLQVAKERGIRFTIARIWEDVPRSFEYEIKGLKNGKKLCPICHPDAQPNLFIDFTLEDLPELAF